MLRLFSTLTLAAGFAGLLSGCAGPAQSVSDMARMVWQTDADSAVRAARLDARFAYLRVQGPQGSAALLVLGFDDQDPLGLVQTFYSAGQETLQLVQGRIRMTHGLAVNRLHTAWPQGLPTFMPASGEPKPLEQIIDLTDPGPRGLKLSVQLQEVSVSAVPGEVVKRLRSAPASAATMPADTSLRWFKEEARPKDSPESAPGRSTAPYFTQWFAVQGDTLVFSHQCIRPDFCLSLQPWPPRIQAGGPR